MIQRIFTFLFCLFAPMIGPAAGCEAEANQSLPRTVFALYDGRLETSPADTRIHRFLELPLNHLGYSVHYLDVSGPDFPESVDRTYAGAVTWFDGPLADPDRFAAWAAEARSDCPDAFSLIVLGETGLLMDSKPRGAALHYLRRIGLGWHGRSALLGDLTDVTISASRLLGFESDFVFRPGRYASLRALSHDDSSLSIVPAGKGTGDSIDLMVQHDQSVYVHQSATLDADIRSSGHFWIMDPFAVLDRTLSRGVPRPVPDVTTLNGRRIYFETVGPEGWLTPAPARTFDEEPRLGSENLFSTLIMPFADLPVTVSVVTGDLDTAIGGEFAEIGRQVASQIFSLPQTAVATSGRSLVRRWAAISETPDTAANLPSKKDIATAKPNRLLALLGRNLRQAFADPYAPAEPQLSDGLRQYGQDPFVLSAETLDAINSVLALAPNKQTPPLFLWSGDGKPGQAARSAVQSAGSPALGGGNSAIGTSPSVSALAPFFLAIGEDRQVYHALPGDLGNLGYPAKDIYALQGLSLLISQTDQPIRLKPFQLAYSAGSANLFASRSIIERLKHFALSRDIIPIFASRYVEMVDGFATITFTPVDVLKWRIAERGGIQTIRFDNAEALSLDLATSEGVLGARRINKSLYVALDAGTKAPLLSLITRSSPVGMTVPGTQIGLVDSNLEIHSAKFGPCMSELEVSGWGQGEIRFFGDPDARYQSRIVAGTPPSSDKALGDFNLAADSVGIVAVPVPTLQGKVQTLTLQQQCEGIVDAN